MSTDATAARWNGAALMALSSLLFAAMAVMTRTVAGVVPMAQLVVVRFGVGLAGVALLLFARRQRLSVPRPLPLVARGVFGGVAVYLYFWAIEELGVGPATLLNYASPVYAAVFASAFLKEKPTRYLIAGLVFSTLGAGIVAFSTASPDKPFSFGPGAWAGLASGVLSGAAMTSIRDLRRDTDAASIFLSFCLVGALLSAPLAVPRWVPLHGEVLARVLAVGVLSLLAQLVFTHAFGFISATAGSAATQLTPAIAWGMAIVFLDEPVRALTALGAVLCVIGVLWGTLAARRPLFGVSP